VEVSEEAIESLCVVSLLGGGGDEGRRERGVNVVSFLR
jgi:hypothetical protein